MGISRIGSCQIGMSNITRKGRTSDWKIDKNIAIIKILDEIISTLFRPWITEICIPFAVSECSKNGWLIWRERRLFSFFSFFFLLMVFFVLEIALDAVFLVFLAAELNVFLIDSL